MLPPRSSPVAHAALAAALLAPCTGILSACDKPRAAAAVTVREAPAAPQTAPRASVEQPVPAVARDVPWIAFGGGSEPVSNQVSLAQDVGIVSGLLDGRGLVLFASGAGAQLAVDRTPPASENRDLYSELSRVLASPEGYRTQYQTASLAIDAPSTSEHVRGALQRALSRGEAPLFVYGASHGSPGKTPADNSLSLWGGWPLSVRDVAEVLDSAGGKRPTRFVITACYGGGFADLIFTAADPLRGLREDDHCGLYAAPADDEASGCDPNPDRRAQESYTIHFLHALAGKDRKDRPRQGDIDIDGDGNINLLEAHTFARIESRSFDIPTTSSERFVRHAVHAEARAPLNPLSAPEEVRVIRALGSELEIDDEAAAREKLTELDAILNDAAKLVDDAQKESDDAFFALRIALLERYPLLDHPWERRTSAMLRREGRKIFTLLTESELARAHQNAERELAEALDQHDSVRIARARVLRLVRAFETLRLASWIYKKGGRAKEQYDRLRRCERWSPPLRRTR